jgi:hypothetical protein
MKTNSTTLQSTTRERYENMLASFRIEGIEVDDNTRLNLENVMNGNIGVAELETQILAKYQRDKSIR